MSTAVLDESTTSSELLSSFHPSWMVDDKKTIVPKDPSPSSSLNIQALMQENETLCSMNAHNQSYIREIEKTMRKINLIKKRKDKIVARLITDRRLLERILKTRMKDPSDARTFIRVNEQLIRENDTLMAKLQSIHAAHKREIADLSWQTVDLTESNLNLRRQVEELQTRLKHQTAANAP